MSDQPLPGTPSGAQPNRQPDQQPSIQPGWYPTADGAHERWHDGVNWTEQTRPVARPVEEPPREAPAAAPVPILDQPTKASPPKPSRVSAENPFAPRESANVQVRLAGYGTQPGQPVVQAVPTPQATYPPTSRSTSHAATGQAQYAVPVPSSPISRRKAILAGGVSAAVIAALGTGAYAAAQFGVFGAPGDQPAVALPANTVAYLAVDFNPSATEKFDVYNLAKKIPAYKGHSPNSLKDDILGSLFGHDKTLTYASDVKPWIGDRAAMAILPDAKEGLVPVIVVQVNDEAKAKTFLDKEKAAGKFDDASFGSLSATLPIGGPIDIAPNATSTIPGAAPAAPSAEKGQGGYTLSHGYAIIGLQRATDSATQGGSLADSTTFKSDTASLPGDRIVTGWSDFAAAKADLPAAAKSALTATPGAAQFNGHGAIAIAASGDTIEATGAFHGITSTFASPAKASLLAQAPADATAALESTSLTPTLNAIYQAAKAQPLFDLTSMASRYGLTLPDDLLNITGTDTLLAGKVGANSGYMIQAKTPNPSRSVEIANKINNSIGHPVGTATATSDGYTFISPGWNTTGGLANNPEFKKVVPDAANASQWLYVDVTSAMAAFDPAQAAKVPVKAVGASSKSDGDTGTFDIRVAF